MKFSEITEIEVAAYLQLDLVEDSDNIAMVLKPIVAAIKSYIKSYTGQIVEFLDTKDDITMVLYVISSEMYENRVFTVENDKVNPLVSSILNMYSINLL